jgi:hypothetical protein
MVLPNKFIGFFQFCLVVGLVLYDFQLHQVPRLLNDCSCLANAATTPWLRSLSPSTNCHNLCLVDWDVVLHENSFTFLKKV